MTEMKIQRVGEFPKYQRWFGKTSRESSLTRQTGFSYLRVTSKKSLNDRLPVVCIRWRSAC